MPRLPLAMPSTRLLTPLALAAAAALAACGGQPQARPDPTPSAADRAEWEQSQAEMSVKDLKSELERLKAQRRTSETTTVDGTSSLPAGTEEIEGGPGAAAGSGGSIFAPADRRSFRALAAQLPGREGIAVSGLGAGGPVQQLGDLSGGVAWSTAKVPVAMAAVASGRGSTADLERAITASDNAAAERLWSALGAGEQAAMAAGEQLQAAGDGATQIEARRLRAGFTPFGQTDWALTDQARFAAGMPCTAPGRRVLALMGRVVGDQRWGLGALGAGTQFKGGWGPGVTAGATGGWLDRQFGVAQVNGRPIAIAIATDGGDHATGTQTLTALAQWVAAHASTRGLPRRAAC